MRQYLVISVVLIFGLNGYSQVTTLITDYYEDSEQIHSQYYALKEDTNIRHGEIIIYKKIEESDYKYFKGEMQKRLIMVKGEYKLNKKVGRWDFYFDKKYTFDFDREKLLSPQLYYNYPYLAVENGIEGNVILQYDIDSTFNIVNIKGISGDSILVSGAIHDLKKFSSTRSNILKKISLVVEDCYKINVRDTIRYRLQ